jgi:hypothetical protein
MPNTYTELRQTLVGTATSSVTLDLTGISGYTDLALVCNAKVTTGTPTIRLQFNSDTGNNYSATILYGDGSAAGSVRVSNQASINQGLCTTEFGTTQIHLMNYSNATTNKTTLCDYRNIGPTYGEAGAITGLWRNTAAITSITIFPASSTFAVGSTFSLYGIANADQGAAKATGGMITEDSQYWYHTFGASGTFTPKQALTCDYLVVAGGGSGGPYSGGGGGAGGVRCTVTATGGGGSLESPISVLSGTPYAITVGAGGPATNTSSSASQKNNGNNSVFSTITSTGGGAGGGFDVPPVSNGNNGGSGGGAGIYAVGSPGSASPTGQGFGGGTCTSSGDLNNGGGGGAGSVGANATAAGGGNGGSGITTVISGFSATYGGGGGGGRYNAAGDIPGSGGSGGGGNSNLDAPGSNGVANTGGGGGSGAFSVTAANQNGGAGGSGIVIVRYAK